LVGDFFIIDESSMIDVFLMSSLLKAIPKFAQILFIGDKNQLPSVGAGDVLHDIISSGKCKVFQLTQIFRQDENSKIVSFSYNVVEGVMPDIKSPLENFDLFDKKLDCLFVDADFLDEKDQAIFSKYKNSILKNPYKYKYLGESSFERKHLLDTRMLYEIDKKKLDNDEINKRLSCFSKFNAINFDMSPVDMIEQLYTTVIPRYYGEKMEIQILSPQKQTDIGTMILNKRIQEKINPKTDDKKEILLDTIIYREGDKVIQLKNNYEKGIFNGEIGYIVRVFENERKMLVDFSYGDNDKKVLIEREFLGDIDLAYAVTIHKSQGSEFDCVIIPISYLHKGMLFKNLIYTGMTRGKKLVIFVGQKNALNYGISNTYKISRNTNLKNLLLGI
jgi:exodeoxyribonuclease V alpha subunit